MDYIVRHYDLDTRRACRLVKQTRSTHYYRSGKPPQFELGRRMRELAGIRIRYGYWRLHVLLKREGWQLGRNQAYRLYREERLQLRSKLPRWRKMVATRGARIEAQAVNHIWGLDFVHHQLVDGSGFRALTVVDLFSREALAIEVGQRLRGEHVVDVLNRLVAQRHAPKYLSVDNGSEFTGQLLDLWTYHHRATLDFNRPGKPTDNCFVETFNGSHRDECLNVHWFETIGEAQEISEVWRRDYNETRPHMSLNEATPQEFARQNGGKSADD